MMMVKTIPLAVSAEDVTGVYMQCAESALMNGRHRMTEREARLEEIEERLEAGGWLSVELTEDDVRWLCGELRKEWGIQVCSECGTLKLGLHGICKACIDEWKESD